MTSSTKYDIKWLDVKALILSILKPHQELVGVKYFTSRVSGDPQKMKRQTTYLEAIQESGVDIMYGKYQGSTYTCKKCNDVRTVNSEKMTDVNIATQMLLDSFENKCNFSLLISADSDLVPPIKALKALGRKVLVAFPPNRASQEIRKVTITYSIGLSALKASQLPDNITKKDGFVLRKPKEW